MNRSQGIPNSSINQFATSRTKDDQMLSNHPVAHALLIDHIAYAHRESPEFENIAIYAKVAETAGASLSIVDRVDTGGNERLLFLCQIPGLSDQTLLESLAQHSEFLKNEELNDPLISMEDLPK